MAATSVQNKDERVAEVSLVRQLLSRPELGAVGGAILVWIFFAIVAGDRGFLTSRGLASYMEVSALLGITAVGVSLLMIGGEFDLSVGSLIGLSGMAMAILASQYGLPLWLGSIIALLIALLAGFINGMLVVRTKLPSFIITLAGLFVYRGLTIGLTRQITGRTQVGGMDDLPGYAVMDAIFSSELSIAGANFPIAIFWWILLAVVATLVLLRTPVGNWIFGLGGDENAARNVGVPVDRLKIGLFMLTAFSAWLVATITVIDVRSADTLRGDLREFESIIAVVIGGTLLTGGYGSAIGAVFGALIFGMVKQGLVFWGRDSDWFQVFMGAMLIIAVLVNNYIRRRAEARA